MKKTHLSTLLLVAPLATACGSEEREPEEIAEDIQLITTELEAIDLEDSQDVERNRERLDALGDFDDLVAPASAAGSVACDAADSMLDAADSWYSITRTYAELNANTTGKIVHYEAFLEANLAKNAAGAAAQFESGFLPWVISDALEAIDDTNLAIGHAEDVLETLAHPRLAYGPYTNLTKDSANAAIGFSEAALTWVDACLGG